MSDEEYEYDYGSDASYDYGSDNGGEDMENESANELIEIENCFYGSFLLFVLIGIFKVSLERMFPCTEGDDLKSENPLKALENFQRVVELETSRGDQVKWLVSNVLCILFSLCIFFFAFRRFKALQNLVVINYTLGNYQGMVDCYRNMLEYISAGMTDHTLMLSLHSLHLH